jgi:peptidyl-prolyl cis-trans isomerase SurA
MKKYISTLLLSLALLITVSPVHSAVLLDRIVATVNGDIITWSELMNVIVIDGRQILGEAEGQEREMKIRQLERPFLRDLVDMKLQIQAAHAMNLSVAPAEVDGAIEEIKQKYSLTEETLMDSLIAEGLTVEDYRARLADQILLQKVVNTAVRNTIVVSNSDIEKYVNDNSDRYGTKEKLRISQIFFTLPESPDQRSELEAMARGLVERIQGGEDFADIARQYSEDPSGQYGGDLGFIERGSIIREVEEAALALSPGETSQPFWSPAGLHIVQLVEKTDSQGIESVKDSIREQLFQKNFEKKYHEWKSGLKEKAHIEIKL